MLRPLVAAALLIAPLAGCGPEEAGEPPEHAKVVVTPAPSAEVAVTEAPSASSRKRGNDAACGADKVGRWLNALPSGEVMLDIGETVGQRTVRYYEQGKPVAHDLDPRRLNVEIGADGRIKRFRCG